MPACRPLGGAPRLRPAEVAADAAEPREAGRDEAGCPPAPPSPARARGPGRGSVPGDPSVRGHGSRKRGHGDREEPGLRVRVEMDPGGT